MGEILHLQKGTTGAANGTNEKIGERKTGVQENLTAEADIPHMGASEAILAYFEQVECAFSSLRITVDKHKVCRCTKSRTSGILYRCC